VIAEILAAIEATDQEDWESVGEERGFTFVNATSEGWTIRIGYGSSAGEPMQDGTASRPPGTIVHLTPEHSRLARLRATGECCLRGIAGLHNALCPKEGIGGR
jgi:hypothetical protein